MNLRSLTLYTISLKALAHRIRYDFARELVVSICGLVVLATFFYVFNDFLNTEVKTLSSKMRDSFAVALSYLLIAVAIGATSRSIRKELIEKFSLKEMAFRLGENNSVIHTFLVLKILTIIVVQFGILWYVIQNYLAHWPLLQISIIQLIALLLVACIVFLNLKKKKQDEDTIGKPIDTGAASKTRTLMLWRLKQIYQRNRLTQLCLLLSVVFGVINILLIVKGAPPFALIFCNFVAGVFCSLCIAFQLQEDLQTAWAERFLGISHEEFMAAYSQLGFILGAFSGSIAAIAYICWAGLHMDLADISVWSLALKLLLIGGLAPIVMPFLMFQIDGTKPAIQIILIILIGLFLATAIFAHWLGVIVFFIFKYYAGTMQAGRFYRA